MQNNRWFPKFFFYSQIKVIDTALLTNRELAKSGYSFFDEYLSKTLPDVIETHGIWSKVSKIYKSQAFLSRYTPVVFENNFSHTAMLVRHGTLSK